MANGYVKVSDGFRINVKVNIKVTDNVKVIDGVRIKVTDLS